MKRIVSLLVLVLVTAACGSTIVDTGDSVASTIAPTSSAPTETTAAPTTEAPTTSAPPAPDGDQLALVRAARELWAATSPDSYVFEYFLGCECDGGPFRVEVRESGSTVIHFAGGSTDSAYTSIDGILAEIEQTIIEGEVPVRAEYHPEFGYPTFYVWNEPELPVDGGFTLEITDFIPEVPGSEREGLEAARSIWRDATVADYDYTFVRQCFCTEEYRGPYAVEVRGGEVVSATFRGTSLLEIETLGIDSFGELVLTVDRLFAEIERSIGEVAELTVDYDSELGYPTNVFIDVDQRMADEEIGYVIDDLRPISVELDRCSTSAVTVDLRAQPDLPDPVAAKRQEIYDAAVACDIAGLVALTSPEGFNASFGGGDPATLWADAERRGQPVLLDLVRHLNQPYAEFDDGPGIDGYTWPSAFLELEAADGIGGYRIGIQSNGDWIYFVAGD